MRSLETLSEIGRKFKKFFWRRRASDPVPVFRASATYETPRASPPSPNSRLDNPAPVDTNVYDPYNPADPVNQMNMQQLQTLFNADQDS